MSQSSYPRPIPQYLWCVVHKDTGEQANVGCYAYYSFYEREDLAQKAIKRHSGRIEFGYAQKEDLTIRRIHLMPDTMS